MAAAGSNLLQLGFVHAQFLEGDGQTQLSNEGRQGIDAGESQLAVGSAFPVKMPDVFCKADKLGRLCLTEMPVVRRMQRRQDTAMVTGGAIGFQLVGHLVAGKAVLLAHLDQAVPGQGGVPHQVGADGIIVQVLHGGAQVADDAVHQGFQQVVRNVVRVGSTEIGLHEMAQDVKTARRHLLLGDTVGVSGIHQGEAWAEGRVIPTSPELEGLVCEDGTAAAGTASARGCHNSAQGQGLHLNDTRPGPEVSPDVPAIPGGQTDGFAAVHDAAAAYSQDHIHLVLSGQLRALLNLGIGCMGGDARKLHDRLACGVQDAGDFIIDAIGLDGAAAVGQQDGAGLFGQAGEVFLDAAPAKVDFCMILKDKVVHEKGPCREIQPSRAASQLRISLSLTPEEKRWPSNQVPVPAA